MTQWVTIEIKDHVASVRLNRPEKYNALSPDMFRAIVEAGETVQADKTIRSVVLSGEGRGFCAGLDFESFMKMGSGEARDVDLFGRTEGNPANYAQRTGYIWKQVPVPVIAAVHGVAYGGGLQIALGADIRLASPDARFSVMEIKWGLIPDMSGTQTLKDLVRLDVAKELTFTGRIVEAEEALRLGLITRICEDPLAEAEKMAREIAGKSPDAIAAGKRLWEKVMSSDPEEGLKLEEDLQRTLIGGHNQLEAIRANFEKRPPVFKDRS
jgi:enoyl-CoA hydratase/carnithine racemase